MDHQTKTPPVRSEFSEPAPPSKPSGRDYTIPIVITVACLFLGMMVVAGVGGLMWFRMETNSAYERAVMERDRAMMEARKAEMIAKEAAVEAQVRAEEALERIPQIRPPATIPTTVERVEVEAAAPQGIESP